ncbi:MAG: hypothetical protein JSV83_13420 [Desulfobacterales bacterium]|nr:MAG: hypothetical protein JSV83_13420 [Desulfobacterales bacterium]
MEIGRQKEPSTAGVANKLDQYDVETILATMDFFGASDIFMKQTVFDLYGPPKYRVFDWLAMNVMGRNDDDRQANNVALKVLVHSYLKSEGDPERFIEDLRKSDYQFDTSWEDVEIDEPDLEDYKSNDFSLDKG